MNRNTQVSSKKDNSIYYKSPRVLITEGFYVSFDHLANTLPVDKVTFS